MRKPSPCVKIGDENFTSRNDVALQNGRSVLKIVLWIA